MITEDMKHEALDFGVHLARIVEKRRAEAKTQMQLHPKLTEQAMSKLMATKGDDITRMYVTKQSTRPRDFFNETKNDETAHHFGASIFSSADYRHKYGMSASRGDTEAQWRCESATGMAYRHMKIMHEKEWLAADNEQREKLKPQHDFEKSYFAYQESRYNQFMKFQHENRDNVMNRDDFQTSYNRFHATSQTAYPRINKHFKIAMDDFKAYQAQKHGISKDEQVPVVDKFLAKAQAMKTTTHTKNYELGDVQANVVRMRAKMGIKRPETSTQTPQVTIKKSVSISM